MSEQDGTQRQVEEWMFLRASLPGAVKMSRDFEDMLRSIREITDPDPETEPTTDDQRGVTP